MTTVRRLAAFAALLFVVILGVGFRSSSDASRASTAPLYLETEELAVLEGGRENFTSRALDPGRVYTATITGTYSFRSSWCLEHCWREGDAVYTTDDEGNFTQRNAGFVFSTWATLVDEERAIHRYRYQLEGDGQKLAARLAAPHGAGLRLYLARGEPLRMHDRRSVQIAFLLAALGLAVALMWVILAAFDRKAQRSDEARRLDKEKRQREAAKCSVLRHYVERREEQERFERNYSTWLTKLTLQYAHSAHYEEPAWLEAYARAHTGDLMSDGNEILANYQQFHQRDAAFISRLKKEQPSIYARATWKPRALALAERYAVESPPPTPLPLKKTHAEYCVLRAEHIKRVEQLVATEKLALKEAREHLEQLGLDPDDVEPAFKEVKRLVKKETPHGNIASL